MTASWSLRFPVQHITSNFLNGTSGRMIACKAEKPNIPGHLDGLQNIGAKVGYQRHRRTGTLDKIHGHGPIRGRRSYVSRCESTLR